MFVNDIFDKKLNEATPAPKAPLDTTVDEAGPLRSQVMVKTAAIAALLDEDWKKVNRKDKTPGMSRKAVKAYRRENPGSKLQTAVTTKPSKLKKGSKSAKRRKSFCARMSGMKKSRASAKTKRNPDSPINKALRRWNCESIEEMRDLVMIAEQRIAEIRTQLVEGSAREKLYRRHQELRKKSGLPDPEYYQELKKTYDMPHEERVKQTAELKKKYNVTNEDRERYIEELGRAGYEVVSDRMLAEKQDACYHKVKSRYKVWPSAYASGALVRCRKVGAKNWGNKSKK